VTRHKGKFLPVPNPATRPFWDACKRRELLIQKCPDCGAHQFYPRALCTSCGSLNLNWMRASGAGTVVSWTVVRHPVSPAYAEDVPFVIALVELEEGPRMMSQIVGGDPESVRSGMAVEVCFEDWTDEITMANFRCPGARAPEST